jgi:uncharacterized membrane protein
MIVVKGYGKNYCTVDRYWNAVCAKMCSGFKAIKFLDFCIVAIQYAMPVCFAFL